MMEMKVKAGMSTGYAKWSNTEVPSMRSRLPFHHRVNKSLKRKCEGGRLAEGVTFVRDHVLIRPPQQVWHDRV